jgi:16S rRNA (uracil1498-N3)-methyltransferase
MPDFRAYVPPSEKSDPTSLTLSPEESHHLITVNRARQGDPVTAFNGKGFEWICSLETADRKKARLKILSTREAHPLPCRISLAQALPKGTSMDDIVRKATELGAAQIIPLESERTQVHLDEDRSDRKTEKWRHAALEAAKQCGNPWLPEIQPVQKATVLIEAAIGYDLKLIASLATGAKSLKTVLGAYRTQRGQAVQNVLWLIGPEGDFSPAEMAQALAAGFEPITLGPLVLRCETAAIYALSVLSYELAAVSPNQ